MWRILGLHVATRFTMRNRILTTLLVFTLAGACGASDVVSAHTARVPALPRLDRGFLYLYNLNFAGAQEEFSAAQRENPDDPIARVSEAAGHLFSEFHRLGILEAQFFANDASFQSHQKLLPDRATRERFDAALARTESISRARLAKNPKDRDALFAMTLASGLNADYAALIEKRNVASLRYTRESTAWAQQLLAVDPNCYDAHVATGISKYIIGTMVAPVRWLLRLGGVAGDKQAGIEELHITAEKGHYLAPFARILLAIAYVREKDPARARQLLVSLQQQFPANPLFPQEIARLDKVNR